MKQKQFLLIAASSMFFFSCMKETHNPMGDQVTGSSARPVKENVVGYVYTLSNQVAANSVLVYTRSSTGQINAAGSYSTGGAGTGTGLGNQGAIFLSEDNNWLLTVNPGSNSIASMKVSGDALQLISTVPSGGIMPVSITMYNGYVYVLNAGGTGNISGFTLQADGTLMALAGSTRPLSTTASAPAQISFTGNGTAVVITEKATNTITTYTIDASGMPGAMHTLVSVNPTPFGFAVGSNGIIYVSEAAGGAPGASSVSSYMVSAGGMISLIDGPVMAGQTAACWVVLSNNEKYVYATNTGSNNISSFGADAYGNLDVLQAAAAPSFTAPIDASLSNNSKFLYVLNSGTDAITVFTVGTDGSLSPLQTVPGVPDGATGLAAK
jgi:6-phosphogluconolactonase